MPNLGFIGLGIMGKPMALRLLKQAGGLVVSTRTKTRAQDILTAGAVWADTPADVARQCDIVFICVTDTPDVESVIRGPQGLLAGLRPSAIVVDHSTISPSATIELSAEVNKAGGTLLDAPISGGDSGAREGTLSIMAGGDASALDRAKPYISAYAKTITLCGPSGNGQLCKLTNQIIVSLTNLAVCEGLSFAQKCGLDLATTLKAITGGAAGSWQLSNLGPKMIAGDNAPGFMIDLQEKDLRLVEKAAQQAGLHLPAVRYVHELFRKSQLMGKGKEGTQALFEVVRDEV